MIPERWVSVWYRSGKIHLLPFPSSIHHREAQTVEIFPTHVSLLLHLWRSVFNLISSVKPFWFFGRVILVDTFHLHSLMVEADFLFEVHDLEFHFSAWFEVWSTFRWEIKPLIIASSVWVGSSIERVFLIEAWFLQKYGTVEITWFEVWVEFYQVVIFREEAALFEVENVRIHA